MMSLAPKTLQIARIFLPKEGQSRLSSSIPLLLISGFIAQIPGFALSYRNYMPVILDAYVSKALPTKVTNTVIIPHMPHANAA